MKLEQLLYIMVGNRDVTIRDCTNFNDVIYEGKVYTVPERLNKKEVVQITPMVKADIYKTSQKSYTLETAYEVHVQ